MRIKAKFKDVVILSSDDVEMQSIIKWTNMLKDDPDAEIVINSEKDKSHMYRDESFYRRFEIVVHSINVLGSVKNSKDVTF
ncbi:MAG TPA: hypothetical protein VF220_03740 [Nitrososphaeraceae archaeon]